MKFGDLKEGVVVRSAPYLVTDEEIVCFARQYDPQAFHVDAKVASETRWGGLIASGFHTCAIAMRLLVISAGLESDSVASPGLDYVKWVRPVRGGDQIQLIATVMNARRSASREGLGVIKWHWQVLNQHEELVLDLVAVGLFKLPA
jgi:acyl dehydratase